MEARTAHGLEYLASPLIATAHGFSTRLGGVSEGYLASLNLGIHRGDSAEHIAENYRRFCAAVGMDPDRIVMSNQVHGVAVRTVTQADCKKDLMDEPPFEADGLITNVPGVALFVFSADCIPVLLFDPVRRAVGACHCGWRGTAASMAAVTVRAMAEAYGSEPADLRCAIGPGIGRCCFETDADVPEAMSQALGALAGPYVERAGEKWRVDLKAINRAVLCDAGVAEEHIDLCEACTCCEHERFWSHRYTRGVRGSQAGAIMLEGER